MIAAQKKFIGCVVLCISILYSLSANSQNREKDLATNKEVLELISRSVELEQISLDSSLAASTLALEKAISLNSDSLMGKALLAMSVQLIKKGESSRAKKVIQKGLYHYKQTKNETYIHNAYYQLGYYYYYEKQFDSSLYYFTRVRDFNEEKGNLKALAGTEIGIGTHYYYFKKDYDKALEHFRSAFTAYRDEDNAEGVSGTCLFIGLAYLKKDLLDSAEFYFNKSYDIAKSEGIVAKELEALSYQASVLKIRGNIEETFQKTKEAWQLAKRLQISQQESRLASSMADIILSDTGEVPPVYAQDFLKKQGGLEAFLTYTEKFTMKYGIPHSQIHLLKYLARYYEKEASYAEALRYHKRYKSLSDSIRERTKDQVIAEVEEKYETAEKEKELIRKEAELALLTEQEQQNRERFTGLFLFLLLGLGSSILYARLKSARAREAKRGKELAEVNLKKELAEKKLAEQSLEMKERELVAQTLTLLRKEEMLEEVQSKLEAAKSYDDMRSVQRSIQLNKMKNRDWEQFLVSFHKLHPDFDKYLDEASASQSITQRERRLAALIKLGLSNREISVMLGVNPASVDQAKYRLKKKLHLEASRKLEEYLSGI